MTARSATHHGALHVALGGCSGAAAAWRLVAALALSATCCVARGDESASPPAVDQELPVSVVAYLPEWRYEGANWETICQHTTHLLLFSLEPGPKGEILAQDRIPRKPLLDEARKACRKHGTYLMLCFGGNGRSAGFSKMTRNKNARARFVRDLVDLLTRLELDGVDYNWEYPGYQFGKGYLSDEEVDADYKGLTKLIRETKEQFAGTSLAGVVTMAYYPDTRQERLLGKYKIDERADLMHMMSYDQTGQHHSTLEYGRLCVDQGLSAKLPPERLTMGVPFYGRHLRKGDWTTYEDLVQRHNPLAPDVDSVSAPEGGGATIGFNGVTTIEAKTRYALEKGIGGVMIWEVGQDCRLVPVIHGADMHVRTCPSDDASLLLAISRTIASAGRVRLRKAGWRPDAAHKEL